MDYAASDLVLHCFSIHREWEAMLIHGRQSVECETVVKQRRPYAALPNIQRGCNERKQSVPVLNISMDIYLYRK